MELKKTFLAGKMNKDLDERLLSKGQYEDALNITIDTSEGSNIGSITNSLGNTVVGNITTILNQTLLHSFKGITRYLAKY